MMNPNRVKTFVDRVKETIPQGYKPGHEEYRTLIERNNMAMGREKYGTKSRQVLDTHPLAVSLRQLYGKSTESDVLRANANAHGMGMPKDNAGILGTLIGRMAADVVGDRTRNLWWLINAPQALANIVVENTIQRANPQAYGSSIVMDRGNPLRIGNKERARELGMLKDDVAGETLKSGYGTTKTFDPSGEEITVITQRNNNPNALEVIGAPAGIAVNAAIGLMNPFGGMQGYQAVFPDEEDSSKTSNVIAEVGAKYILGRTGNLLPWDEFKKVRPDVSKDEYMKYKAFKFDKSADFDLTDGDITLPTGVLKYTTEGIHGPEVQFLGRSLPLTTGFLPFGTALAGAALGVRPRRGENPVKAPTARRGLIGSTIGLAAGGGLGLLIESERQRRNMRENVPKTTALDPEGEF